MQPAFGLLLVLSLVTGMGHAFAAPQSPEEYRKTFLQAEQFLNQDREREYFESADSLKGYALYPYLHYQWLKKHLDDNRAVQAFLLEYPQSRYAQGLRQKWLLQLGKTGQWSTFLDQYHNTDDLELQCYAALARFQDGERSTALNKARQLWLNGKSLPPACDSLFELLKASDVFTPELVWQRFHAALKLNNQTLAAQLSRLLPAEQQADAGLWLRLHRQPALVAQAEDWKRNYVQAGSLFAYAVDRWLNSDALAAMQVWDAEKQNFSIPQTLAAETEQHLAVELALSRDSRAYGRLSGLAEKTAASREWQVRAALYQQNWQQVVEAVNALKPEEKQQDKWQYWQARAWAMTGAAAQADALFRELAGKRSYYGFLAAARLNQPIAVPDQPLPVADADIRQLQAQEAFQVVSELLAIDRKAEAKKQWWFAVARLDHNGLLAAAKLAQQWQLPALAIFTIARANAWDDMELRFPLLYNERIQAGAAAGQLDPALIYGLIRQESAFDERAESPAGARGLMQLMPGTGRQIARELKQNWKGESALFDPDLNIHYGSLYYKKLLRQYNGNHVLSTAAYNAGTHRVKRWLPEDRSLPGDIWIESIPYKETRNYVGSVLQYALIYQHRLHRNSLTTEILSPEIHASKN
ncbi:MAG: transglycosylase SLT domain-containing protein [Methylococcales bacterium]|nr:transglycosylase SLT domain-containing protein [Methylococcales bacterium]